MDRLRQMLKSHPHPVSSAGKEALRTIVEATECSLVCTTCADACLAQDAAAELADCIRLDLECAEICRLVARLLARPGRQDRDSLERALNACTQACLACATECQRYADRFEHCRICAEACRACAEACGTMVPALVP